MSYPRILLCLSCVLVLSGCGKSDSANDQYGADAALLAAKDNGVAALTKRLHENLRLENDVVIVDGPIVSGAVTMSKNSPWSAACGDGLAINIGKGEIDLIASTVQIDDAKCAYLTKRLGSETQAIIDGKKRR
jgi:hypothetical protein